MKDGHRFHKYGVLINSGYQSYPDFARLFCTEVIRRSSTVPQHRKSTLGLTLLLGLLVDWRLCLGGGGFVGRRVNVPLLFVGGAPAVQLEFFFSFLVGERSVRSRERSFTELRYFSFRFSCLLPLRGLSLVFLGRGAVVAGLGRGGDASLQLGQVDGADGDGCEEDRPAQCRQAPPGLGQLYGSRFEERSSTLIGRFPGTLGFRRMLKWVPLVLDASPSGFLDSRSN